MSTIIARKKGNKITIASDSQMTTASGLIEFRDKCQIHILKSSEEREMIVGSAGNAHLTCLLLAFLNKLDTQAFVELNNTSDLLELFAEFIKWAEPMMKHDADHPMTLGDNRFIILFKNNLWLFEDFFIKEVTFEQDGQLIIGSGEVPAKIAMRLGKTPLQALKIASEFDAFTGGPYYVVEAELDNTNKKFSILSEQIKK